MFTAGAAWRESRKGRRVAESTKASADAALEQATSNQESIERLSTRYQGNGKGDVTAMLEGIVEWTEMHDVRHKVVDANLHEIRKAVRIPEADPDAY